MAHYSAKMLAAFDHINLLLMFNDVNFS